MRAYAILRLFAMVSFALFSLVWLGLFLGLFFLETDSSSFARWSRDHLPFDPFWAWLFFLALSCAGGAAMVAVEQKFGAPDPLPEETLRPAWLYPTGVRIVALAYAGIALYVPAYVWRALFWEGRNIPGNAIPNAFFALLVTIPFAVLAGAVLRKAFFRFPERAAREEEAAGDRDVG